LRPRVLGAEDADRGREAAARGWHYPVAGGTQSAGLCSHPALAAGTDPRHRADDVRPRDRDRQVSTATGRWCMNLDKIIKRSRDIARPFRVTGKDKFRLKDFDPDDTGDLGDEDKPRAKEMLQAGMQALTDLQDKLYAQDRWSLLLVFQAMDAAGKDGAIKHVMSGVNPQGCQVVSFKAPSSEELDHDFLWRCTKEMPNRGNIGIFNRSYYEETLVVRVHPEYLANEK